MRGVRTRMSSQCYLREDDLPEKWQHHIELNEKLAGSWPNIIEQQDPHPEAEKYRDVEEGQLDDRRSA